MLEDLLPDSVKFIQESCQEVEFADVRPEGPSDADVATILVDEEYQFRVARSKAGRDCIEFEGRVLRALAGQLPLPIPEPLFSNLRDAESEPAFLGWKILPGVPLSPHVHDALVVGNLSARVVSQAADFMDALHRLGAGALGLALPRKETREEVRNTYAEIRELLVPAMRPQAVAWTEQLFERFLADDDYFQVQPAVRHGGLYGKNLLVAPQTGQVTGVLDFRFLALGDPAMDVATFATISELFFSRLYEADRDQIGPLLSRAQYYKSILSLLPALEGARTGNQQEFERGIAPFADPKPGVRAVSPAPSASQP